jgi:hypothetical protein
MTAARAAAAPNASAIETARPDRTRSVAGMR